MADRIIFRRNDNIGAADAENDDVFLDQCFVDIGDFDVITDCQDPKCIVLGRTGVGKTALLRQIIRTKEHVTSLSLERLSLDYVSNSNVIKFFEDAGVSLDLFYTLLWRHVLTVELLRLHRDLSNEHRYLEFMANIRTSLKKKPAKLRALDYLTSWGEKFWETTEYRTKELTQKLETDLRGSVKVPAHVLELSASAGEKVTEEQKLEIVRRGTDVVNKVQLRELHEIIELLANDILDDQQKHYYITIDKLDEGWADDRIRLKLIRALLETLRAFKKIQNVKIILALREDLLHQLLLQERQPGFQEEKYQSLYLRTRWTRGLLVKVLNERIQYLFERQYTTSSVKLEDLLPAEKLKKRSFIDYILDRTFLRPREAILFLNECIRQAEGKTEINFQAIRKAEVGYSQQRLTSLYDEWRSVYPSLERAILFLTRRKSFFSLVDVELDECVKASERVVVGRGAHSDKIFAICEEFYTGDRANYIEFAKELLVIFYQVGLVSIKPAPHLGRQWSYSDQPIFKPAQVGSDATFEIHKTFLVALGAVVTDDPEP